MSEGNGVSEAGYDETWMELDDIRITPFLFIGR